MLLLLSAIGYQIPSQASPGKFLARWADASGQPLQFLL